jgi:hypothetical protein
MMTAIAFASCGISCLVMLCYMRQQDKRIDKLQCDLFHYATHEYVMGRFTNVWSEIHHTQDAVSKLQAKRGAK